MKELSQMEITEVKVHLIDEDKLKAFVTLVIEGCFVIRDIKIIQGTESLFVAMPSKRRKDGQYKDIAHPLNQETRKELEDRIFSEYEAQVSSMQAS